MTDTAPAESPANIDPSLRMMIYSVALGALAPALDTTIVNVAIQDIGQAFDVTVAQSQWTITGYLLAMGVVMPVSGWATARFGSKGVWLFSLSFFLATSILSGLAWNLGSLITFRVLQGAGAGLIMPIMTTMLVRATGSGRLGKMMSIAMLPVVVVPVFGPVIGGLLVGVDWRWIFFVNVPVCLGAIWLARRHVPDDAPTDPGRRLDIAGLLLLAPGLGLTIFGVTRATGTHGFADPMSWAPLTVGVVLTAVFALYVLGKKTGALINLRVLRIRSLAAAASVLFLSGLSVYGPLLLLALYFQEVRGHPVVVAGLLLAAQGLGSLLPRGIAGKLTDRLGARPIALVGLLLTALGTLPFVWAGTETSEWLLGAALFIRGAGLAPVTIAVQTGAFAAAPHELVPDASSVTRIVQQIGGSLGAAVLVLILAAQVTAHASQPDGLALAYNTAFAWSIGFVLLAVVPALFLPGRRAAAITSGR